LFVEDAAMAVADPNVTRYVVTNSVPPFRLPAELAAERVEVVDATSMFAAEIGRQVSAS
jgi:ribose-phosphate pyrophosphokinase